MIKMIATDIDGTLVNSKAELTQETIKTLVQAHKQGVKIILCTGRPLSGIVPLLEKLGLHNDESIAITQNGAQAVRAKSAQPLFRNLLSYEDFKEITNFSKNLDVDMCMMTTDSKMYVFQRNVNSNMIYDAYTAHMDLRVRELNEITEAENIAKVTWTDTKERIDAVQDKIPAEFFDKYDCVRTDPIFFDFMNKKATKGAAVLQLAQSFGLKPEEVMVAGDQQNDLSMITSPCFSVAMGNGAENIKAAADYVTATNDEDGLAKAIQKFVLK